MSEPNVMRKRQRSLTRSYVKNPAEAWVADSARSESDTSDPLHGKVVLNGDHTIPVALHSAVGGDSDAPVPGDILAGALAGCLDLTIRVVASRLGVTLRHVSVNVVGEVDVRGALLISNDVPVGLQRITISVDIAADSDVPPAALDRLLIVAGLCSVVLQTLRGGVAVDIQRAASTKGAGHAA